MLERWLASNHLPTATQQQEMKMADAHKDYVDEILGDWAIQEEPTEDLRPMEGGELVLFPRKGNVDDDNKDAEIDPDLIESEGPQDTEFLLQKLALGGRDGTQILGNAYNAGLILQADHRTRDILGYDEFREQVTLIKDLAVGVTGVPTFKAPPAGAALLDYHIDALQAFLQAPSEVRGDIGGHDCNVTKTALISGISNTARQNVFNPVLDMIEAEEWDGTPRIETWLSKYLGCPDDEYHREIGMKWLVGAVTRAYEPGAKFDFVLTVCGVQGALKSTMFETLGCAFYKSLGKGAMKDEKKLIEATQGGWIVEVAEMAAMQSQSQESMKNFISTAIDTARLAYERAAADYKRRFIFGATTNRSDMLDDPTGGRRYWIVKVRVPLIDTNAMALEVGQFWAEAAVVYKKMREENPTGHLPLFLSPAAKAIAEEMQQSAIAYDDVDAMADEIRNFLETPNIHGDGSAYGYEFFTEMAPKEIFAAVTGRPMAEYVSGKVARDFLKACHRIEYVSISGNAKYIRRIKEKARAIIIDREKFLPHFAARLVASEAVDLSAFDENGNPKADGLGDMGSLDL